MKRTKILVTALGAMAFAFGLLTLASCGMSKEEAGELIEEIGEMVRTAYNDELDAWAEQYTDSVEALGFCGYMLYDVNGDSIPELWIMGGSCEADKKLAVYAFELEGIKEIYAIDAPHVNLYLGDDYVLCLGANNGEVMETKLTCHLDSMGVETVFEGQMNDEAGYVDPTETPAVLISYADRAAVDDILKEEAIEAAK